MALHNCDEVAVAGFGYDMNTPHAPLHYYETVKMSAIKENSQQIRKCVKEHNFTARVLLLCLKSRRRWRRGRAKRQLFAMLSAADDVTFQRRNWKMVVWVFVSLLPLVVGDRPGFSQDPVDAVSLVTAMLDEQPFDTLPEIDEELGDEDGDSPGHDVFEPLVLEQQDQIARWERSPRSSDAPDAQPKGSRKKKRKKKKEKEKEKSEDEGRGQSSRDCHLERREMRVRDLGMGYDSDEIVLFKFCVGWCQSARGNYDAALRALLTNGSLPKQTARKVSMRPCCRPTAYKSVSFMDTSTTWRTIENVSALDCKCVG
ncbi:Artemin [Bagarius yarrelli]|uniref:Artemin n=1 Tax=Bagarius yarrelli TaxID=175774 RepID=A0A556V3M6_BAGYA|nr:Artemin [Bagarius yarrelli]